MGLEFLQVKEYYTAVKMVEHTTENKIKELERSQRHMFNEGGNFRIIRVV